MIKSLRSPVSNTKLSKDLRWEGRSGTRIEIGRSAVKDVFRSILRTRW
jgi:hypothetical protein